MDRMEQRARTDFQFYDTIVTLNKIGQRLADYNVENSIPR